VDSIPILLDESYDSICALIDLFAIVKMPAITFGSNSYYGQFN